MTVGTSTDSWIDFEILLWAISSHLLHNLCPIYLHLLLVMHSRLVSDWPYQIIQAEKGAGGRKDQRNKAVLPSFPHNIYTHCSHDWQTQFLSQDLFPHSLLQTKWWDLSRFLEKHLQHQTSSITFKKASVSRICSSLFCATSKNIRQKQTLTFPRHSFLKCLVIFLSLCLCCTTMRFNWEHDITKMKAQILEVDLRPATLFCYIQKKTNSSVVTVSLA